MALDVTLASSSGPTTYRLKCSSTTFRVGKPVMAAPLAGGVNPIILDLGSFSIQWTLEGTLDETAGNDGGIIIPSKVNLEDFVTNLWNSTITLTVSGDAYVGKITDFSAALVSGREDLWDFRMALSTVKRT